MSKKIHFDEISEVREKSLSISIHPIVDIRYGARWSDEAGAGNDSRVLQCCLN